LATRVQSMTITSPSPDCSAMLVASLSAKSTRVRAKPCFSSRPSAITFSSQLTVPNFSVPTLTAGAPHRTTPHPPTHHTPPPPPHPPPPPPPTPPPPPPPPTPPPPPPHPPHHPLP